MSSFCPFRRQICSQVNAGPRWYWSTFRGDDLILCQITSQSRRDAHSITLDADDFANGQLNVRSFIRPNRLFTVEQSVVINTAAKINAAKLDEALAKARQLFS